MATLGGNVVIRDGDKLDFCWREAVKSLLPVCDMVSICDSDSSDGTQEAIREWMKVEPKLVLCVWPWPSPQGNPEWFADWINYNRMHVAADWQFQLDADEVLSEKSYDEVRRFIEEGDHKTGLVTRWNFWKDHRHTIPEGVCLGKHVVRLAPKSLWLASDGYDPRGTEAASKATATGIEIFHVGFLREREQFFEKERLLQGYYFSDYDKRLEMAEKHEGNWMAMENVTGWENRVDEYSGHYPEVLKPWLRSHGYEC